MLVSSLDPASSDTCVAALTTAAPTMCHIDATDMAPPQTSESLANSGSSARWLRWATQVVKAASLGRGDDAVIAQGRIFGQRPQLRVDDADPVDRTLGVHVHPEVLQAGVPGAPLEHDQRHDASDDDVGQSGGQLLGHRGPAVGLLGGDVEHL